MMTTVFNPVTKSPSLAVLSVFLLEVRLSPVSNSFMPLQPRELRNPVAFFI